MAAAAKFLFDLDLAPNAPLAERPVAPAEHAIRLAEAESRGYRDGFAAAEREGTAEAQRRTALAFEQIGDALGRIGRGLSEVEGRLELEAVEVAVAVGRKLAPALVAREPFAEIEALAKDCFKQLSTAPHVVVRVNEGQLDVARERLEEIARLRGFDGRLMVIADPDVVLGGCTVEWADGGVTRDAVQIESAIASTVTKYIAARDRASAAGDQP